MKSHIAKAAGSTLANTPAMGTTSSASRKCLFAASIEPAKRDYFLPRKIFAKLFFSSEKHEPRLLSNNEEVLSCHGTARISEEIGSF